MGDIRDRITRVSDRAAPSMEKLAKGAGISRQTLVAWRVGRHTPRPDSIRQLGTYLKLHAQKIDEGAEELLELADEMEGPPEEDVPEDQEELELAS